MKKTVIIVYFISLFINVYSQNYFQIKLGNESYLEGPSCAIQNYFNEYIITAHLTKNSETIRGEYLIKLSESGKILKEGMVFSEDSSIYSNSIIPLENNTYLTFSIVKPKANYFENNKISLTQIDNEFNVISKKEISFPINNVSIITSTTNIKKANNNEIICYGSFVDINNISKSFIYKLTNNCDSLIFKTIENGNISDLEINKSEKIYYFGPRANNDITVLNYSDFTYDTLVEVFNLFGSTFLNNAFIEFISDTSFAIYSKYYDGIYNNNAIFTLDTNFNILNENKNLTNLGQPFQTNSLDVNSNKEIISSSQGLYSNYYVTKTDINTNIIWQRSFNNQSSTYWFYMISTIDGGCLLLGTDDALGDITVVKVDNNGSITHINGEIVEDQEKYQIFPNPCSDFFTLELYDNIHQADFYIYNTLGQLVINKKINTQTSQIDVSFLEKGVYFFKLVFDNDNIEQGKVIIK